ncbi:MAG: transposase, partial [Solirubrobacterales bacterium]|nr:transposase [Solirubrobacterales bacterium]
YAAYRSDGVGRRAYDPAMMVALILYAFARGVRSTRAIERACQEDVAFKLIAMMETPDHATIARFIVRHEVTLGDLFGQVLAMAMSWPSTRKLRKRPGRRRCHGRAQLPSLRRSAGAESQGPHQPEARTPARRSPGRGRPARSSPDRARRGRLPRPHRCS